MRDRGVRAGAIVLMVLLVLSLTSTTLGAQTTAEISGRVTDQSGAVLPGVDVTATQTDTGVTRNAVTNELGSYLLTNLPIGPYRLEVALPGFRTYVQTGIVLQVGASVTVNASLEVGQVAETVEVQADAALVETRTTSVGQVIDNQRVLELPLNGRQVTELILLSGVANSGGVNANNSGVRNYPTVTISVAGGMGNGLTYLLDGGTHNDIYNNLGFPMPFPDALQEFKVETSAMPAQFGQHSAGVMNAVTKSGTNEFHGSLFEFLRNGSLNARNAFALTNDGLKRNQFGGTIGGPIAQSKVFFFGAYQGTIVRSAPTTARQFVPTPAMMAGDFTAVTSTRCRTSALTLRAPFQNNRIDPAMFSPVAVGMVTGLAPNRTGSKLPPPINECGEVRFGRRENNSEHLTVGKIDYQLSDKHSIFGRYLEARRKIPNDYDPSNWLSVSIGDLWQNVYSLAIGDTYLIGTGTVSSFRATANRSYINRLNPKFGTLAELGVRNVFIPYPGHFRMSISNGFDWAVNIQPGHYSGYGFQFSEDFSTTRGAHQFGYGVSYIRSNLNANSGVSTNPTYTFSGQAVSGMGLADFLLGKASTFRQGNETVGNGRQNYIGVYAQDTWKVSNRLTVNAGLRWEPFLPAWEAHGQTVHFNKEAFDKGIRSTVFKNAPPGLQYPPIRGSDEEVGDGEMTRKYHQNSWLHFAPRLGLAWDPNGDGRMTVRAAGGVFFDYAHLWNYSGQGNSAPFGSNITRQNPPSFEDPWVDYPGGNPFPIYPNANTQFLTFGSYTHYNLDHKGPYVYQWNLSVQRQIGQNWLASANYLGNSVKHLVGDVEDNPSIYIPGASCVIAGRVWSPCSSTTNVNERRVLHLQDPTWGQYFAAIMKVEDGGTSHYNGMLLSLQSRRANGLTVQTNYTWSHCIGDPGSSQPGIGSSGTYPDRRRFVRSNCAGDRRHVVNMSTVYETPQFTSTALRALASGWRISGLIRLQTGSYFTVSSGFDTSLTGAQDNNRAHQVLLDAYASNKSIDQWLNPLAFARPANGEWGNAANSIQGPGDIAINMGLTRTFQVRENQTFEFRAEAFNLPNHLNPGNPNTSLNSQDFGKILSAGDPRIVQLALKYVF